MDRPSIVLLSLALLGAARVCAVADEKRLFDDLFLPGSPQTRPRPVSSPGDAVQLNFSMNLLQILKLDEREQTLHSMNWLHMEWHDETMRWNPDEYGGVEKIRVSVGMIWSPDMTLYNSAESTDALMAGRQANVAVVKNDGTVIWVPKAVLHSSCALSGANFPFDTQHCTLKFGSWAYSHNQINLSFLNNSSTADTSYYIESGEWTLVSHEGELKVQQYECCPESYSSITYTLKLRRNANFQRYAFVWPCFLLLAMLLSVFWIPVDCSRFSTRIVLAAVIFICYVILLVMLLKRLPTSATSIPTLGSFYLLCMFLTALTIVITVFIGNIHHFGDTRKTVPGFVRNLLNQKLAHCFCMRRPSGGKGAESEDVLLEGHQEKWKGNAAATPLASASEEWRFAAVVLDRLFFIGFLCFIVIASAITFAVLMAS